ncbi:glycosyltransferase family 4 protein [Desertimonas flava]|uniref:glycosyltransferase family 4 protein n=1 Tax=Desertimonas flava TaxID=2064846 RepID=UPI001D0C1EFB|nr:glycosyltransferase family 4 protein [Desertimonas flava]
MTDTGAATIADMAADMIERGVRRVHVLAWRDLDDDDAGGSEVHADEFMRRWAAAGLEITHRTSAAVGRPPEADRNGYHVVRRGSRYSVFPRTAVAEVLGRMGPFDALVEIWNGVPWFSPVWCRRPRITVLHHVHGPMWDQILPRPLAGLGRALEARLAPPFYRRTSVVTPSEATRDELIGLGFRPDRVTAVHNGVDPFFSPGPERSPTPLVVAVGRFAPVKRFEVTIAAAVEARRHVPELRLRLVGDGPLRGELERLVASHGAGDWVTFTGRVAGERLRDEYRRAWVVASGSLAEGWGLTLTEAAACGTPAVATDIPGHRCSVVDGVTGVLASPDALGAALTAVLTDGARRQSLADAALARAAILTWEASATGVLRALHGEVARQPH